MSSSGKTEDYIKRPSYIGATSLLTIQEEEELREVIAQGKINMSGMTQTQKQKLFKNCRYYLKAAQEKLNYLKDEAQDQFTDIIENGYRRGIRIDGINSVLSFLFFLTFPIRSKQN